jgi:hypothetical protein
VGLPSKQSKTQEVGMSGTGAFIWFVATTVAVISMLVAGIYMAVHSYDPHGGVHLRHRHH